MVKVKDYFTHGRMARTIIRMREMRGKKRTTLSDLIGETSIRSQQSHPQARFTGVALHDWNLLVKYSGLVDARIINRVSFMSEVHGFWIPFSMWML